MKRIAEPELMNGEAQARAYAEADFEEPHNEFIRLLRELLPDLAEQGTALDLGCGAGDISLRFARAFPSWKVHGVEGSRAMLSCGHEAVERAGLQDRVWLVQAHLPGGSAPHEQYDLVFSNSLLHHLADPMVLWASLRRWAPGGVPVFVVDLMRPESRKEAQRLVDQYAEGEPEVLRRDFFNSLLAAYRLDEVEAQLAEAGLGHLNLKPTSDRHLTVWGRR